MWVDDIANGAPIRLDRSPGPGAVACLLDPDALAEAACLLQPAVDTRPQLIVVSRFGNTERAELANTICSGAAVLVAVKSAC